jgi:hypothetical protein
VPALPAGLSYTQVGVSDFSTTARRSDGSIVVFGNNGYGQGNVPALPAGTTWVDFAAGTKDYVVGLRSDGQAIGWGYNVDGQCNVPPPPAGQTYTKVAASLHHSAAIRSDGSLVAWGRNDFGQCNVPSGVYVDVALGWGHGLALRPDGQIIAWGTNGVGECSVPGLPAGLTYVDVAASYTGSAALRSDGSVVVWGDYLQTISVVPPPPPGMKYVEIDGGNEFLMARLEPVGGCTGSPVVYCTAKLNSLGCLPAISSTGAPSATATSGFIVRGANVRNNKNGLLFYGTTGRSALPFQGGTLCVKTPLRRTGASNSGGVPAPVNDCSGVFAIDMNTFAHSAGPPSPFSALTVPGTVVDCQWWGRDPGFAAPKNTMLTDALEYFVCPK